MQNKGISYLGPPSTSQMCDVLERVLDKGIIIAGDIKIKLIDVELLTIQIRLVICSIDKAREIGMDWWVNHPVFGGRREAELQAATLGRIEERLTQLEATLAHASDRKE
jgi:Gas vesicle protein